MNIVYTQLHLAPKCGTYLAERSHIVVVVLVIAVNLFSVQ